MKQSEQSKAWMVDALLTLMKTKEYSAVTIKDITSKAGVSRLTFYRNFESKDDIIRYHMSVGFQEYLKELNEIADLCLEDMIAMCYRFWEQRKEEIQMLSAHNLDWLLREPFENCLKFVLHQLDMEGKYSYFQLQFLIGGMFSDMIAWLNEPQGRTPNDIAKEIIELIKL